MDIKRVLASAPRDHDPGAARPLLTRWGEALDPENRARRAPAPAIRPRPLHIPQRLVGLCFRSHGSSSYRAAARCVRRAHPRALLARVSAVGGGSPASARRAPVVRAPSVRPAMGEGERCLLHFEAVDFACACCVNGQVVGTHEGGYLPFPSTSPRRCGQRRRPARGVRKRVFRVRNQ